MSTALLPLPRRSPALPAIFLGWIVERRPGHHGCVRRPWFIWTEAYSPVARYRVGIAGGSGLGRWIGNCRVGSVLPLLHRLFSTAVYYAGSRWQPFLLRQTLLSGALYGAVVYFFMDHIVVPLSATRKHPFSVEMMLVGLIIHTFCVGLPIAIATRRFAP